MGFEQLEVSRAMGVLRSTSRLALEGQRRGDPDGRPKEEEKVTHSRPLGSGAHMLGERVLVGFCSSPAPG